MTINSLDRDLDVNLASLTHGLLPEHVSVFLSLADSLYRQNGFYHTIFGSTWLRDHYLDRLTTLLASMSREIIMLDADTDIIELLNRRLEHISLAEAMKRPSGDSTTAVILVNDAANIAVENWSLLIALMRNLPVMNLACLACWLPEQDEQRQRVKAQCRELRQTFRFDLEEMPDNIENVKKVL